MLRPWGIVRTSLSVQTLPKSSSSVPGAGLNKKSSSLYTARPENSWAAEFQFNSGDFKIAVGLVVHKILFICILILLAYSSRLFAQSGLGGDQTCRAQAKEVALKTYSTCMTDLRQKQLEIIAPHAPVPNKRHKRIDSTSLKASGLKNSKLLPSKKLKASRVQRSPVKSSTASLSSKVPRSLPAKKVSSTESIVTNTESPKSIAVVLPDDAPMSPSTELPDDLHTEEDSALVATLPSAAPFPEPLSHASSLEPLSNASSLEPAGDTFSQFTEE